MLRILKRVFDRIGFPTATTLLLQILYQNFSETHIALGAEGPPEVQKPRISVMTELKEFAELKFPRWIG